MSYRLILIAATAAAASILSGCATTAPPSRITCEDIPVFPTTPTDAPSSMTNYLAKVARTRTAIAEKCGYKNPPNRMAFLA